jgi:hypothetical protein
MKRVRSLAYLGTHPRPAIPDGAVHTGLSVLGGLARFGYWSPARTEVMRWVLKPSQCMRPT